MRESPMRRRHPVVKLSPVAYTGRVDTSSASATLLFMAAAYTLFVIYGSLVPLHFHSHPWEEAWESFRNIRYLNLGIESRADWVANILLFVPLAFAWLGVLGHEKNGLWRILASIFVFAACVGLSTAIEFTQIFFPPRTVSLNDIIAEALGAILGIFLWWTTGPSMIRWYAAWQVAQGTLDFAQRLLYVYLFLLFGYNILPLDLTISPVEIYHKWREGRVILLPFGYAYSDMAQKTYGLFTDVLIWIPVAFLRWQGRNKPAFFIWLYVVSVAALLEFLQLFVYTRVSDVTDIVTAALGGGIGIALASAATHCRASTVLSPDHRASGHSLGGWLLPLVAVLGWVIVLGLVFWYPFDFHFEKEFIRERLLTIKMVPFEIYYFGTEYRAATEVLHKVAFFLPLGALLALTALRVPWGLWRRLFGIGALLLIGATALGIELGKVLLPAKYPDLTNWFLEFVGGVGGYAGVMAFSARLSRDAFGKRLRVQRDDPAD